MRALAASGASSSGSSLGTYFGRYTRWFPPNSARSTSADISMTPVNGTQSSVMFVT